MEKIVETPVGQLVAKNYAVSSVLEKYRIDFFNRGERSLLEIEVEQDIDREKIVEQIERLLKEELPEKEKYNEWPLDKLVEHIILVHHAYTEEKGPIIKSLLETLTQDYGEQFPQLDQIKRTFDFVFGQMAVHQKKEELILFPYIRKMMEALRNKTEFVRPMMTKSAERPVDMLTHEHTDQGEALEKLFALTKGYTVPEGMDDFTYEDAMQSLADFETHLHQHLHLENNILFPKALALDRTFG